MDNEENGGENNGGIGSATDMGSIEGSVSADAPGALSSDRSNIESSMSTNNGGGLTDSPQVGTLDLDPNVIGGPIAVMDNRIEQPAAPAFIDYSSMTAKNLGSLAVTVGVAAGAVIARAMLSPAAVPALVTAAGGIMVNADVMAKAAADAQKSMGLPGAFVVSEPVSTTVVGDPVVVAAAPIWTPEQSVTWYAQWTPDSGGGGGGGSG